jgi:hypothetical protein
MTEVLATSDLTHGVVNVLTGYAKELLPGLAQHMDVNALDLAGISTELRVEAEKSRDREPEAYTHQSMEIGRRSLWRCRAKTRLHH